MKKGANDMSLRSDIIRLYPRSSLKCFIKQRDRIHLSFIRGLTGFCFKILCRK